MTTTVGMRWKPLQPGPIKINIGLDRNSATRKTGIGVVARDCDAKISKSWALKENSKNNRDLKVAEVVRLALIKAAEKGWSKVLIEVESKLVVEKLKARNCDHFELAI
ncbi:hypothetical protein ACH5RR_032029 [Cinchona calisaya]|uniref:RNase H type-1 domain-containing protein n=1 Tax=Cinchona calisaya TaxID=153742 RepID=A0ABD2YJZ8_9GENT